MMTQSVGVPFTAKCRSRDLAQAQRIVERERMRHAALVGLRRHHPHVVRQRARDAPPALQAGGMDAVVVGAENAHISPAFSMRVMPPI